MHNNCSVNAIKCILCDIENSPLSLEHIIPKALYKGDIHDIFRTKKICKSCNNWLGLHVDGSFLRNVLITYIRSYVQNNIKYILSTTINIKNDELYRIDLYSVNNNSNVYLISKPESNFVTYIGGKPSKKKANYAIIELNTNFQFPIKQDIIEQYLKDTVAAIKLSLSTSRIYIKNLSIKINVDNKIATTDQELKYYQHLGVLPYSFLEENHKKDIDYILTMLKQEVEEKGYNNFQFSINVLDYYIY